MIKLYLKRKLKAIKIYCDNDEEFFYNLIKRLNEQDVVKIGDFCFSKNEFKYAIFKYVRR